MTAFAVSLMLAAPSFAASQEGLDVARLRHRTAQHLRISNAIATPRFIHDLDNLAYGCGREGWDGHGALAVDQSAVWHAHRVLDATPPISGGIAVSMGAEPDGQVTIEWHRAAAWTLSVSVSPNGELHYAALLGSSNAYGTEPFDASVGLPETIKRLIRRIEAA